MKKIILITLLFAGIITANAQENIYKFTMKDIHGKEINLEKYKNKTILIVNTASKCGLTPQYEGLEELYKTYNDKGLVILGFPCNQFLGQEPGTAEEIENFCTLKYKVTFPLFDKIEVNGDGTHPLYQFLKKSLPLETEKNNIRWNFEKFLIDKNGIPVKRFSPKTKPAELITDIEMLLEKK